MCIYQYLAVLRAQNISKEEFGEKYGELNVALWITYLRAIVCALIQFCGFIYIAYDMYAQVIKKKGWCKALYGTPIKGPQDTVCILLKLNLLM